MPRRPVPQPRPTRAARALRSAALVVAPLLCAPTLSAQQPAEPPAQPPAEPAAPATGSAPAPDILSDSARNIQVLTFFAEKCSECHTPQVAEPGGDMDFILDLPQLIKQKEVVPGHPEQSRLMRMLDNGKMPPRKAANGKATPDQIDLVRRWIAGDTGAPGASGSTGSTGSPNPPRSAPVPKPLILLGRLHPLIVHFPVGLLVAAALADAMTWRSPRPALTQARNFCAVLGALGAAAAAGLGWLNAWADHHTGEYLDLHRWLGTAAAALAVIATILILTWRNPQHRRRSLAARILLLSGAALIGIAAHFGGMMVYGSSYFFP